MDCFCRVSKTNVGHQSRTILALLAIGIRPLLMHALWLVTICPRSMLNGELNANQYLANVVLELFTKNVHHRVWIPVPIEMTNMNWILFVDNNVLLVRAGSEDWFLEIEDGFPQVVFVLRIIIMTQIKIDMNRSNVKKQLNVPASMNERKNIINPVQSSNADSVQLGRSGWRFPYFSNLLLPFI